METSHRKAGGCFLHESKVRTIKLERTKKRPDYESRYCKKTTSGNVVEFIEMSSEPTAPPIKKISATQYLDLRTGQVCDFCASDTRADNVDSLRKSFKQLRSLINCNATDNKCIHWVTLTYAENMTDTKRLLTDFDKFWKRFRRYCTKCGYDIPEYITAIEPQQRGAWHIHALILWRSKRPYIDNNAVFQPMWGQGFTKIQGVPDGCDNLGAYLSAYLADMALSEDSDDKSGKKYQKGARLRLYPVGVNIYRHSRGVQRPTSERLNPEDAEKEKASSGKLTFMCSYTVTDDDGRERIISKSYYNKKRR